MLYLAAFEPYYLIWGFGWTNKAPAHYTGDVTQRCFGPSVIWLSQLTQPVGSPDDFYSMILEINYGMYTSSSLVIFILCSMYIDIFWSMMTFEYFWLLSGNSMKWKCDSTLLEETT